MLWGDFPFISISSSSFQAPLSVWLWASDATCLPSQCCFIIYAGGEYPPIHCQRYRMHSAGCHLSDLQKIVQILLALCLSLAVLPLEPHLSKSIKTWLLRYLDTLSSTNGRTPRSLDFCVLLIPFQEVAKTQLPKVALTTGIYFPTL